MWSVPRFHFRTWGQYIFVNRNITHRQLDDNLTTAITKYITARISSPFDTSYVVTELHPKRWKELDRHRCSYGETNTKSGFQLFSLAFHC